MKIRAAGMGAAAMLSNLNKAYHILLWNAISNYDEN